MRLSLIYEKCNRSGTLLAEDEHQTNFMRRVSRAENSELFLRFRELHSLKKVESDRFLEALLLHRFLLFRFRVRKSSGFLLFRNFPLLFMSVPWSIGYLELVFELLELNLLNSSPKPGLFSELLLARPAALQYGWQILDCYVYLLLFTEFLLEVVSDNLDEPLRWHSEFLGKHRLQIDVVSKSLWVHFWVLNVLQSLQKLIPFVVVVQVFQ